MNTSIGEVPAALTPFSPLTQAWFQAVFAAPTPVQEQAWPAIARGEHTLMVAPTGSGKTLAGFLWAIDRLARLPEQAEPGVRVLYISPLKALVYDVEKNLRAPLHGLQRLAERQGQALRSITHAVRTGDTSQKARAAIKRHPPDILITTPESLYLMLTSQARETLRSVQAVIIDEIHTMAGSKRGAHLALSLERLSHLCEEEPQRIGISATQRPLELVARYLGGDRPVRIVDASQRPDLDLLIRVPMGDMTRPWATALPADLEPQQAPEAAEDDDAVLPWDRDGQDDRSIWPALHPHILELIQKHNSTILFTNSRILCEKLAQKLNELAGHELVMAHHGSVAHERRTFIEERLKEGKLKGIVATSSLELGIDMGAVDLVILVESPGAVSRGLQRAGRAGHGVGQRSVARIFPKHRGDLLEAAAVAMAMEAGEIEHTRLPRNPLDVLCQQVVAMVSQDDWSVAELHALVKRAAPFSELSGQLLSACLDMLSGRYPSDISAELRPRLTWHRDTDTLTARRGSRQLAILNAGTIPDRGTYTVHIAPDGPRIGQLDEEMVHESRRGHTFVLGASTWRIQEITRDRVLVTPAPGEPARMPFWRGQGPGRPQELGRALGAFCRELSEQSPEDATAWLMQRCSLDALAAQNLLAYVQEQVEATGALPSDRCIVVERFRDELGDWRICILSPFGRRIHAPWAQAIEAQLDLEVGFEVQTLVSDDGIAIRLADSEELPADGVLMPDPEALQELLMRQLDRSAVFATEFRESAARALLLPRKRPGKRTPLWAQRLRAQSLMAGVLQYPGFPMLLEATRACLQDHFDLPGLQRLLEDIRSRKVRVVNVETAQPSPMAQSLSFQWVAAHLYEGDAPLAERRAQALRLDPELLRDLLGEAEIRALLEPAILHQVQAELQWLSEDRQVRHADRIHDLLRRVGHLNLSQIQARCALPAGDLVDGLISQRRVLRTHLGGVPVLVAVEDASLYRDALGVVLPPGLASVWLESHPDPLRQLVMRYARTHVPFSIQALADWLALPAAQCLGVLELLEREGKLVRGPLHPEQPGEHWCERGVMRRLRRRTLAHLRSEIAAVDAASLSRFLQSWQGVDSKSGGQARLLEVVEQLEGLALPWSEWERRILPLRVKGYSGALLDELGAMGAVVWVGAGALGARDGKVQLLTREMLPVLLEPPTPPEDTTALHEAILGHLRGHGADFFVGIAAACGSPPQDELLACLWDLVWWGLVSNDTTAPLRALRAPQRSQRGRRRGLRARRSTALAAGGRWWLVESLHPTQSAPPTERTHARAVMLLERYGVCTREALQSEGWSGGFGPVYRVLAAMEEAGRLRRGWFVDGLGGAQFALPGAVDALRAPAQEAAPVLLSALDPANPYGTLLPWPGHPGTTRPSRRAGSLVVLHQGRLLLWLRPGQCITFTEDPEALAEAARCLARSAQRMLEQSLLVEEICGEPALSSPAKDSFLKGGFELDGQRLRLAVI